MCFTNVHYFILNNLIEIHIHKLIHLKYGDQLIHSLFITHTSLHSACPLDCVSLSHSILRELTNFDHCAPIHSTFLRAGLTGAVDTVYCVHTVGFTQSCSHGYG